ncbi:hypothetical protein MHYP_G00361510 [Metynnis hypsauchen]
MSDSDGREDFPADVQVNEAEGYDAYSADQATATRVIHYKVELPPCFHGDGKDKESFSLWKARQELAVKACTSAQTQTLATILPTRLSGDALAYWLSLPPSVPQNYEQSTARLSDVFGRKQFLLRFQTFVNARPRMPKEPLEVYAAEITRLVLEAFPNYAGLDPVLQSKCHEHGATTLDEALSIACKWERAEEALRLAAPSSVQTVVNSRSPVETTTAMVSTKQGTSPELVQVVKELSTELKALRLEVNQLKQQRDRSACLSPPPTHVHRNRHYSPDWSKLDRGTDKHRYSPHSSPDRYGPRDYQTCLGLDSAPHGPQQRRHSPSPPSSPRHTHHSSWEYGRVQHFRTDPRRSFSPGSRYPTHHESSFPADFDALQKPAYSPRRSASPWDRRRPSREHDQRVSFGVEDTFHQGNGW